MNPADTKARIEQSATTRAHSWRTGDTHTVNRCTRELDDLWAQWRIERAQQPPAARQPVDNPIDRFITDCCDRDTNARITTAALHAAYLAWCEHENEDPITAKRLTIELRERGIQSGRTKEARHYTGLQLAGDRFTANVEPKRILSTR